MSDKQTNWLLGCGIGCAVVVVLSLGIALLGVRFVRQTTSGFEAAVETRKELEQRHGKADSFVPAADGSVAPERMAAFLAVREASAPARERLAEAWANIPLSPAAARELESQGFAEKMKSVFEITRSGIGLGAEMGELYEARNRAMAEAGIGFGEYTYIYALAYYSWLGHSPAEGPESAGGEDEAAFGPRMGNVFIARIRGDLLQILRNQMASLPDGADEQWRATLAGEIEAVEGDSRRLPWQDGLPPQVAASFEPYRDALEASYSPVTNAFELGRNRKRGRMSFTAD